MGKALKDRNYISYELIELILKICQPETNFDTNFQPYSRARKICYNMYEFICSKRANTFGKLAYKDWINFCAIDPLVFYNDYYGMIDANNDGKLGCP